MKVTRRGRVIRRTSPERPAVTIPLRIGLGDLGALSGFAGPDLLRDILSVCFAICSGLSVV
ncbi:MAG TPA: hypothetical protein VE476_10105 [Propionibacteriaceae bacterium]|nr:hypothetical protein [Propionibacteriaceae bacterium]